MPKNQPRRIIDDRRAAGGAGGGGAVLPGHTHDGRYFTEAEIAAILVDYLLASGATTGATAQAQTFTSGVIDSSLTASRLLASDGSQQLSSVANLASWIAGTANRVTVTDDGDGTITLSAPQDIHTAATPTFAGVVTPYIAPAADSTTAVQIRNADKSTAVLTVNTTNGRIGVNVTPQTPLHVIGTPAVAGTCRIVNQIYDNTAMEAGVGGCIAMGGVYRTSDSAITRGVAIGAWKANGTDGQYGFDMVFWTRLHNADLVEGMRLTDARNLNIGGVTDSNGTAVVILTTVAAPSTSSADATQLYSADLNTDDAGLHIRSETGAIHKFGSYASLPGLIVNDDGAATAAADLRAESDTEANMLWLDASDDLLYLGGTVGVRVTKGGGVRLPVATKAADYTLTTADNVIVFTATATATMPAATGTGQTYRIICRAGTLTIDANGAETIKGATTAVLAAGEDLILTDTAAGVWE